MKRIHEESARQDHQDFETNASYGFANGYSALDASAMGGTNWGSGDAYMAVEHKINTCLLAADRGYTQMDLTGIGGRDLRGTQCPLANITAPGGKNYAARQLINCRGYASTAKATNTDIRMTTKTPVIAGGACLWCEAVSRRAAPQRFSLSVEGYCF